VTPILVDRNFPLGQRQGASLPEIVEWSDEVANALQKIA
jgi:hypothetical protein